MEHETPQPHRPHVLALALVRPLLTVVALVVAYFLLPVDRALDAGTLVALIIGLCLVVVVIIWETRAILRARYPRLQGLQALAVVAPLFLLVFANAYYVLAHNLPASFTAPLSRTDSLYFVVTVFATVGFGDIAPVTETARVLVTVQMIGDLLLIGIALRVILSAVERAATAESHDAPAVAGRRGRVSFDTGDAGAPNMRLGSANDNSGWSGT